MPPTQKSTAPWGGKVSVCSYCDMTFKKLEHAQRHERTHTLDRPYSCGECGKTFARQDTLNRHARLHNRKDDAPGTKGRRKRTDSVSSSPKKPALKLATEDVVVGAPLSPASPGSFPHSLPVQIPQFPAYSRPLAPGGLSALPAVGEDHSYAHFMGGLGLGLKNGIADDPFAAITSAYPTSPNSDSSSSEDDDSRDSYKSASVEVESHYPSPAFTSYSPSALHDTMSDLQAILENDPLHASMSASSRAAASAAAGVRHDEFDYDGFAASVEGPSASAAVSSFDHLLDASRGLQPYPTPLTSALPNHFDFSDFGAPADRKKSVSPPTVPLPPAPANLHPLASLSIPSFTIPVSAPTPSSQPFSPTFPTYASSFPSLSVMPNGLGLHDSSPDILFEAYLKRRQPPPTVTSSTAQLPGFYIPSEAARFQVQAPSWSPLSRDGIEKREPGAFVAV
ncbi:zinc finger, C2H2-type domain containing protein [Pseudohyphozyma bogoriensis]|nr:zinc finger, C2H2-type domain containing protein [Pseudohyphozyma bogoriensis]